MCAVKKMDGNFRFNYLILGGNMEIRCYAIVFLDPHPPPPSHCLVPSISIEPYLRVGAGLVGASHLSPGSPGVLNDAAPPEGDVPRPCSTRHTRAQHHQTPGQDLGVLLQSFSCWLAVKQIHAFPARSMSYTRCSSVLRRFRVLGRFLLMRCFEAH